MGSKPVGLLASIGGRWRRMRVMELIDYHRGEVEIQERDSTTRDVFEFVRDQIAQVRPGVAVEHIGSSAVPGMPGKNYVDVMVLPDDPAAIDATAAAIDGLGLKHARGYRPERPFFVGAVQHDERVTNVHVYVIPGGADEAITQHGLAEALRADPKLRDEYAAVKRRAVGSGSTDPVRYSMDKGDWVDGTIERLGLPPLPDPGPPPREYLSGR